MFIPSGFTITVADFLYLNIRTLITAQKKRFLKYILHICIGWLSSRTWPIIFVLRKKMTNHLIASLSPFNCPIIRLAFAYKQSDTSGSILFALIKSFIDVVIHSYYALSAIIQKVYNSYTIVAIRYLCNLCYYTILLSNWISFLLVDSYGSNTTAAILLFVPWFLWESLSKQIQS